jgi:DNA-binding transcriptional LysR family regulator
MAVAEDLHFRKAAERLYISQPGLSRQIKQLEENLRVKLFDRNNRKVVLTKAGEYLKQELTINLKNLDYTLNHAKLLNDGKLGDLKFGYVGSAIQQVIPELLLKFKKHHPNIVFSLKELDNQEQIQELLDFEIDLGFVRQDRVPKGLEIKPILTEPFCLVLPRNHALNANSFKNVGQLKNESFILFNPDYSPLYYEKVLQIFDDCGFTPIISHKTIHATSIFKLVENNFGISIVPKSLMDSTNSNIKFIELSKLKQKTTLSIVWNKNNRNPVLKEILNYV